MSFVYPAIPGPYHAPERQQMHTKPMTPPNQENQDNKEAAECFIECRQPMQ
jgi:hypothetical protein